MALSRRGRKWGGLLAAFGIGAASMHYAPKAYRRATAESFPSSERNNESIRRSVDKIRKALREIIVKVTDLRDKLYQDLKEARKLIRQSDLEDYQKALKAALKNKAGKAKKELKANVAELQEAEDEINDLKENAGAAEGDVSPLKPEVAAAEDVVTQVADLIKEAEEETK